MTISKSNAATPAWQEGIAKAQAIWREGVAQGRLVERREPPQQLFLPGFDAEEVRAIPNHIARSSLFAPIRRGRRKLYADEVLVSRADAKINFWGYQLDEADADVWLQAIKEAMRAPLGEAVTINRAEFLRQIGRNAGKTQYEWLNESMHRLAFAMLTMTVRRKDGSVKTQVGERPARGKEELCFHLVQSWRLDEDDNIYELTMDKQLLKFFTGREYGFLDWKKRLAITGRGTDLAKSLQRLLASSASIEQKYSLEFLKGRAKSDGRMRDFRAILEKALQELKQLGIIAGWRIEISTHGEEQAVIDLPIKQISTD